MKRCTACGELKARELFSRRAASPDGLRARCKLCCNASNAVWHAANAGRVKERQATYRAANADKEKVRKATWRGANANKEKVRKATWRGANADKEKARCTPGASSGCSGGRAESMAYGPLLRKHCAYVLLGLRGFARPWYP